MCSEEMQKGQKDTKQYVYVEIEILTKTILKD